MHCTLVLFPLYFPRRALSGRSATPDFLLALHFAAVRPGLVEGYVADKAALEESLQQKEALEERLVEELEDLKAKLHQAQGLAAELESLRVKHEELGEEHSVVLRQKEHLSAGLGETEKGEEIGAASEPF